MKVELLRYTADADTLCGEAAGTCYQSNNPVSALKHSAGAGHESVLEHAYFTFRISGVSRVLLAQLTRHRLASFSVESQRYVKLTDEDAFVYPEGLTPMQKSVFRNVYRNAMLNYEALVQAGVKPEDARYLIPQAAMTTIVMSCNARELKHILELRCCNRAQAEIRHMADEMYRLVYPKAPAIFAKAGCGCVNGKGCHESRPCGHPRKLEEWQNGKEE